MPDYTISNDEGAILITSTTSITLQVGDNVLTISDEGITVNGTTITLSGDAEVSVETASMSITEG